MAMAGKPIVLRKKKTGFQIPFDMDDALSFLITMVSPLPANYTPKQMLDAQCIPLLRHVLSKSVCDLPIRSTGCSSTRISSTHDVKDRIIGFPLVECFRRVYWGAVRVAADFARETSLSLLLSGLPITNAHTVLAKRDLPYTVDFRLENNPPLILGAKREWSFKRLPLPERLRL